MSDFITKLSELIDPEVMGDMVSARIPKKLRVAPFAKIDDTLQGVPGDTITVPAYTYIGDASDVAKKLAQENLRPDVITVDPPRKGLAEDVVESIARMQPEHVVYVSCDSATMARDVKRFAALGYRAVRACAVDLFPRADHVETVVLLSKGEVDSKKIRVEFSLEDMDMSEFQDGATYTQIKDYVLEHSGLKVSNLYISQIKRKCGIEVGKNFNLPKSDDSRQPQCPPEKEKAIREAFKYFGMI